MGTGRDALPKTKGGPPRARTAAATIRKSTQTPTPTKKAVSAKVRAARRASSGPATPARARERASTPSSTPASRLPPAHPTAPYS